MPSVATAIVHGLKERGRKDPIMPFLCSMGIHRKHITHSWKYVHATVYHFVCIRCGRKSSRVLPNFKDTK